MKTELTRIILADDHKMFREGLVQLLTQQPDIEVVAEADNGEMLLTLTRKWLPDIIFADINMPVMDGVEATRIINKEFPSIYIIALSMLDEVSIIEDMLGAGAQGYLLKNAGKVELRQAIDAVQKEQQYLCTETAMKLAKEKTRLKPIKAKTNLSDREIEVLLLLCKGYNNKQISDILYISLRTVEGHRERMREKTGNQNVAGMIIGYNHYKCPTFIKPYLLAQ